MNDVGSTRGDTGWVSEQHPGLPAPQEWARLGVTIDRELHAGKQSRVFVATLDGRKVAVKLTHGRLADRTVLVERMLMAEALAREMDAVVAPVRIDGELVHAVGGWLAAATPFVDGRQADVAVAADAQLMGGTLAGLHRGLAWLRPFKLPPVAALEVDHDTDRSRWQLLHGDFSDQNVIVTSAGPRVFDFDDCGYGPAAYDLAQSLYMVLFDAQVNAYSDRYEAFRPPFLLGYADAAGTAVDHAAVDSFIGARIAALGRWLDDLATAPIGIRTSSPEWQKTLRAFVLSQDAQGSSDAR